MLLLIRLLHLLQLNALHGEHYLELLNPLPRSARLVTKPQLIDIQDKGSGAVAILQSVTVDAVTNQSIAINEFTTFVKGAGESAACQCHWPAQGTPRVSRVTAANSSNILTASMACNTWHACEHKAVLGYG
jgi:hypothetical protein